MSIRRHYKKDSRYVNDLYTLTYDNHESLEDTVELISSLYFRTDIVDVSCTPRWKFLAKTEIYSAIANRFLFGFTVCLGDSQICVYAE
jgi:hypothetical protein